MGQAGQLHRAANGIPWPLARGDVQNPQRIDHRAMDCSLVVWSTADPAMRVPQKQWISRGRGQARCAGLESRACLCRSDYGCLCVMS